MEIPNYIPKNHLFIDDDLPLFEVTSTFAYCQVLLNENKGNQIATFDLFVRDMPKNRNFMLFGGLEEIVCKIKNWKFKKEHILALKETGIIDSKMAKYLVEYKFTGSIDAMPEGAIFFPGETVLRLTAPIIEANLFYAFFVNCVASNTVFMSKAIRATLAAKGKRVVTNGGRALGFEAGAKFVRAAYIAGLSTSLQLSPLIKYDLAQPPKLLKATFHAYIKAFESEIDAFEAFVREFPDHEASLMIDTYDFKQGLKNAIIVGKKLKQNGQGLAAIFIDSGDLAKNCKLVRRQLDLAGLRDVQILAASNLDEWKIEKMVKDKIPCDIFMAVTELSTVSDDPKLEIVYKMAELTSENCVRQTMKFTAGKKSYPGKKQIYRFSKNNVFIQDIIGLSDEKIDGQKLLIPIFNKGILVYKLPRINDIKKYVENQINMLPDFLKKMTTQNKKYEVVVSKQLASLIKDCLSVKH